ncbi:hypothetical protein V6N12_009774 [Hibiscus sabdariffa]|uniref:Uncharacterized protein n=1 Tax=Hibiscus sabdariffa TaxID=183260 RepID=A0ABR2EBP0_9ROSI
MTWPAVGSMTEDSAKDSNYSFPDITRDEQFNPWEQLRELARKEWESLGSLSQPLLHKVRPGITDAGLLSLFYNQPIRRGSKGAVRKIGPLRKAELFGSLPLCGRPSYQSASFLLMEYNNARASALLAFFTGAHRIMESAKHWELPGEELGTGTRRSENHLNEGIDCISSFVLHSNWGSKSTKSDNLLKEKRKIELLETCGAPIEQLSEDGADSEMDISSQSLGEYRVGLLGSN